MSALLTTREKRRGMEDAIDEARSAMSRVDDVLCDVELAWKSQEEAWQEQEKTEKAKKKMEDAMYSAIRLCGTCGEFMPLDCINRCASCKALLKVL
jgi:hypothetical protein